MREPVTRRGSNLPWMPREEIARRYPLLLRAMRHAAILSVGEAECALDMRINYASDYGPEAVDHFGGVQAVIRGAIRCRHITRRLHAAQPLPVAA